MAKAEVVGEVAMLVVADAGKFAADLQKKIKKAVTRVARTDVFAALTTAAGKAGDDAGDAFARGVRQHGRAKDVGRDTAKDFAGGLVAGVRSAIPAITSTVGTAVETVGTAFKTGFGVFSSGITGIAGALSSAASSGPAGLIIGITALIAGLGALVTIGPAVIGVLVAVGAALASLIGLIGVIPASIGVLLIAFAPLILAFQGFGETIGALVEGDLDKFNESLKKLSPSARAVAREFKGVLPFFKQLQQLAQEALFSRLVGGLTQLTKVFGPALRRGVVGIADAFGSLFQNLAIVAQDPKVVGTLDRLFQTTQRIINAFNVPVSGFFLSLVNVIDASLPAVEKFFDRIAGGLDSFASFITKSTQDGSFQRFLDRAFETLDLIWEIITNVGVVLADVFLDPELQTTGLSFFEAVNDALKEMHEFFQSDEGKQFLTDLNTLAKAFIETLRDVGPVLAWLLQQIATVINGAAKLIRLIDTLRGRSGNLSAVGAAVANAANSARGFAAGGEVSEDGLYRLAEGNKREVILPMTNPARARQVARETGVTEMLSGNSIGGSTAGAESSPFTTSMSEQPVFIIQIGNEEIEGFISKVFTQRMDVEVRRLMAGTRGI